MTNDARSADDAHAIHPRHTAGRTTTDTLVLVARMCPYYKP